MTTRNKIVRNCRQQIKNSAVHPLKKLQLEIHFYRLLQALRENIPKDHPAEYFMILRDKVDLVVAEPDDNKALQGLEDHIAAMNAAFIPPAEGRGNCHCQACE